jgi:hypothetical protein
VRVGLPPCAVDAVRTGWHMTDEEDSAKRAELARLLEEHSDLDAAIAALERLAAGDRLQIQRLKKRKLWLKDAIALLQDQLTPDIIA